jgi:hypothetical protein
MQFLVNKYFHTEYSQPNASLENSIEDLGGNSDNSMKPFPQIEKE